MSQETYRFILQAQDPDHGCPVLERLLVISDLGELRSLLGPITDDDPELLRAYRLDAGDLEQIAQRLGVVFDWNRGAVWLCPWNNGRDFPYLIHTGYELALMLEGRKPFAFFDEEYPPHRHSTETFFDPHVSKGLLYKHVDAQAFATPIRGIGGRVFEGVRTVCYALRGEEWRVPAWKLVREAAQKAGWTENFERLEGMLLGYEDWQNDWYIARYRQDKLSPRGFGGGPSGCISS